MAKIYLICPVRRCTPEQRQEMDSYVSGLEAAGHEVHYPPRDVDQSNDDGGVRICTEHRDAMLGCDEVHVWWDERSTGSHFDAGMAFMLMMIRDSFASRLSPQDYRYLSLRGLKLRKSMRIVMANRVEEVSDKSFTNVLLAMAKEE